MPWHIVKKPSDRIVATVRPDSRGHFRVEFEEDDSDLREAVAARPRDFELLVGVDEKVGGHDTHGIEVRRVRFKANPDGYMMELDWWLRQHGFGASWKD